MTTTLVLYLVLNGHIQVSKIKQPDEFTCAQNAVTFMAARPDGDKFKPLHAECIAKATKPRAAKPKKGT